MNKPLKTVAVEGKNTLGFLDQVFRLYDAGQLFTVQRPGLDLTRYAGLEVIETMAVGDDLGWGQQKFTPGTSDAPAQILFSSGTEGLPKPIVLSQRNISDVVQRLNAAMELDESVREYVGVPSTYSFGLGRIRAVSAVGGKYYLPARFDPIEIREMLERGEINAISAVPTLWRVILQAPDVIGPAGDAVKWIEIGSQYMSGGEKEALRRVFPKARIVQHYGLTEASRTTFLNISQSPVAVLESVGAATPPAETRIGTEDEICIRGDHVALGLLAEDGQVEPLTDDDGWLHTKDKGRIEGGMLYYEGRLDDQMNIAGVNLNADNLEQEINRICGTSGQIGVTRTDDALRGDAVLIAIRRDAMDRAPMIEKAAEIAMAKAGINQPGGVHIFAVDEIPVTGTGKVQRKKIQEMFTAQPDTGADDTPLQDTTLTTTEQKVADVWRRVVGPVSIKADDTFYDTGGDSLSAVQIGLAMEKEFDRAAVRATLEGQTLRDIAALHESDASPAGAALPERTARTWAINITRGLMVLAVLFSHWGPGLFKRLGIGEQADYFLGWIYVMGTEGFAVIFGIGLAIFFLPGYAQNKPAVRKRLRLSFWLVLSGLTIMAAFHLTHFALRGEAITGLRISLSFYNILAYYVLAFLTVRFWLDYLSGGDNVIFRALLVCALAIPIYWLAANVAPGRQDSLLEWPRLMAVAGYSYFKVSAFVFAGIAAGYWYGQQSDTRRASHLFALGGIFGMAFTMIVGADVLPESPFASRSSPFFGSLMGFAFYFFLVIFLVGAFEGLLRGWTGLGSLTRGVLQVMIVVGGLALPIYAFHGVVIPAKDILKILGLPGAIALLIPLSAFLSLMAYFGWRLRRMYFG
ncbi:MULTISPECIES: AMP-binding protein [unclassified Roseovarius]|uniref:AMP-binding protein n=1 Tax=unclassified Roseovarius TaxID=2614913 RepID=UPI00273FE19B|nr:MULTISPECIES: AMP-binding protein [unclassified Roseovarius]